MKGKKPSDYELLDRILSGNASAMVCLAELKKSAALVADLASRFPPEYDIVAKQGRETFKRLIPETFDALEPDERALLGVPISILLRWSHPEWFFPLGFDQMRFNPEKPHDLMVSDSSHGVLEEVVDSYAFQEKLTKQEKLRFARLMTLTVDAPQFRTPNGSWHGNEFMFDKILPNPENPDEHYEERMWTSLYRTGWISQLERNKIPSNTLIYMPALCTPISNYPDIQLQHTLRDILSSIANERISLSDLHWRTLEELLAELLYDAGLDVEITNRSWDGGRDIIARGEIIPGEPTILAVEVKQMNVVPISQLRAALWANRGFPALLFATSGRFSAGIYREKYEHDNVLRLYLKDGIALEQWIHAYANRYGFLVDSSKGDS